MKRELRTKFDRLDRVTLVAIAQKTNITIPDGAGTKEIAELIEQSVPDQLEHLLEDVYCIHLENTEVKLQNQIGAEVRKAVTALTQATDEVRQRQDHDKKELTDTHDRDKKELSERQERDKKELTETHNRDKDALSKELDQVRTDFKDRLDAALKGFEIIKWIVGGIVLATATITAVGTFYGIQRATDLEKTKTELDKTKTEFGTLETALRKKNEEQSRLLVIHRHYLLTRIRSDYQSFLEEPSFTLPDSSLHQRIRENQKTLEELADPAVIESDPVEVFKLQCLLKVGKGLLLFEHVRGRQGGYLLDPLKEISDAWENIDQFLKSAPPQLGDDQNFYRKDLPAYAKNVQAVAATIRWRFIDAQDDDLKLAVDMTEAAVRIKREFVRPYINRANIEKYRLKKQNFLNTPSTEASLDTLSKRVRAVSTAYDTAQKSLDTAATTTKSTKEKLVIYNNKADWGIQYARQLVFLMRHKVTDFDFPEGTSLVRDKALSVLERARISLNAVKGLVEKDASLLITEAELDCVLHSIHKLSNSNLFNGDKRQEREREYGRIINLIDTARLLQFDWGFDKDRFLRYVSDETCFDVLGDLTGDPKSGKNYLIDLERAAGYR